MNSKNKKKLLKIETAAPKLENGKYKIDFRGTAKIASNKNFILSYE